MWTEKLAAGVVRVVTPIGPRYIELSFIERAYFLWIFRHFDSLPQQVLSARQNRIIDRLCLEKRFVSMPSAVDEVPVIGTLERRPVVQLEEPRNAREAEASGVRLAADAQPRS
jgi:hypothetical protein